MSVWEKKQGQEQRVHQILLENNGKNYEQIIEGPERLIKGYKWDWLGKRKL